MNELRWILIGCGVVLLFGIYLWGRRGERGAVASAGASRGRPEPQFAAEPADFADDAVAEDDDPEAAFPTEEPISQSPQIVVPRRSEPVTPATEYPAGASARDPRRSRIEPTFTDAGHAGHQDSVDDDEMRTAELPVDEQVHAPTVSMSNTPPPRRIERRKIISLRLAASAQRYTGEELLEAFEAESLEHGRYDVFHRVHDGASVFCVASMVEPGTFDPDRRAGQNYPGVTLFAQLPGPLPGVHALQDLVTSGKRLQERLGGTLQDDRGVPLTVHRIDKLRQDVVDFERAQLRDSGQRTVTSPPV
jgi:cell division protein ZipA